ncbi:MAG: BrxA/BrxB family bacilliredoxin [Pyrinomonadaceae bacterium]|nr:BrxA/BrxB family bacilliredoxin [Pyrinomonadaceae bacterium]
MPYPEIMIRGMRQELTGVGVEEAKTPEQVIDAVENTDGTLMVFVNSVCGCAAGAARPGIAMALQNDLKPTKSISVFAGADIDATDVARDYFKGYTPSSPSIALLNKGEVVFILERRDIEGRHPQQIAQALTEAFDKFCATDGSANAANN